MTVNEKRIRIFEIIAGILLILLALNMYYTFLRALLPNISYITFGYLVTNIPAFLGGAFMILNGIMIICRKYDKLWIKIVYGITGAAAVMSTNGGYVIRGLFDKRSSSFSSLALFAMYTPLYLKLFYIASAAIMAAAMIVALLSMCGVIKWRSRSKLLMYTYLMTILEIIICLAANDNYFITIAAVMLPCFMQEAGSETKKVSIIGEVSLLLTPIFQTAAGIIYWLYCKVRDRIIIMATSTYPAEHVGFHHAPWSMVKWGSIILLALIPLMAFGRKFISENEASPAPSVPEDSGEAGDE